MNEVKRDNETLREIKQFQLSIENLVCNYPPIQLPLVPKSWDALSAAVEEKMVYLQLSAVRPWIFPLLCLFGLHTRVMSPVTSPLPGNLWCLPLSLSLSRPLLPGVLEDSKESPSLGVNG